jgi:hypothetical protein
LASSGGLVSINCAEAKLFASTAQVDDPLYHPFVKLSLAGHELLLLLFGQLREARRKPGAKNELPLDPDAPAMLILRRIRDEVHRFAIKSSKAKLSRNHFYSPLMNIEGVGRMTAKKLLKAFVANRPQKRDVFPSGNNMV